MQLTYVVRAYPTAKQHTMLADYLEHARQLYNAALQERLDAYRKTKTTISNAQQARELTKLRADPEYGKYPRRMQRWAINLVETSYKGMFTRHKKGEKLGVPKFRGVEFWNTVGWDSPIDFKMRQRGLYQAKSLGGTLRLRPDRELPPFSDCTAFKMCRDGNRWFAHLTYKFPDVEPKSTPSNPVGLDLGLKALAARSDGAVIDVPRQNPADTAEQRRVARALARCKKRSKRRARVKARLRRINRRIAAKRRAHLHILSARITHHFDAVSIEDLNLKGLVSSGGGGASGRGIRKSWHDRAAGTLTEMLEWKSKRDGRQFVLVDPRGTSILCSACGARVPKTLRNRVHRCECGAVLDRDVNAARNILARAGWGPGLVNPGVSASVSPVARCGIESEIRERSAAGPRRVIEPPPSPEDGPRPPPSSLTTRAAVRA